jgi:phospho-N-acetylmuramoyl-pentapeptide-transferase
MKSVLIAAGFSLIISILLTPLAIRAFRRQGMGQEIRDDGPESHLSKKGTPTMGGTVIVGATVGGYVAAHLFLTDQPGWGFTATGLMLLFLMVGMGTVGFLDDYLKIRHRRSLGLNKTAKLVGQLVVGVAFAVMAINFPNTDGVTAASTNVSYVRDIAPFALGAIGFVILAYLFIAGFSNAVNLTDGLDGLAIVPVMIAAACFALISYVVGNLVFANYLQLHYVAGSGELAVFCGALIGAGLGFLWFNAPPAMVFMGDTGSLSMGGALGSIAVIVKHEIVLAIVGGLFVLETMSVIVQVVSYKLTGKRVFRMAPLHHHYEKKGWAEPTIVIRFWIIATVLALVGLATLKLR